MIVGNAITIAGVAVCAVAGRERTSNRRTAFRRSGCPPFLSGGTRHLHRRRWFSAMFNFGYAFGSPIIETATALGSTPANALNAIWLIELAAGGVINLGYCWYLLNRNRSWALLGGTNARDWSGVWMMALLWTASVVFYGVGRHLSGVLGPTLGWSLWNAILILTTMACGVLTGEWDGARGRPMAWLVAGVSIVIVGMFVLGMSASPSVTGLILELHHRYDTSPYVHRRRAV